MSEPLILAFCLLGYVAISTELLAYAGGSEAVPRPLRLGIPLVPKHSGPGKWWRTISGVAFLALAFAVIALIVVRPSAPRSDFTSALMALEFVIAIAWTAFVILRLARAANLSRE